jgi:hypothetical protein
LGRIPIAIHRFRPCDFGPGSAHDCARIGADLATAEVFDDLIDLLADDSPAMHEAGAEAWHRWRADSQKRSGGLAIEPERPSSSVRPINAQNPSG